MLCDAEACNAHHIAGSFRAALFLSRMAACSQRERLTTSFTPVTKTSVTLPYIVVRHSLCDDVGPSELVPGIELGATEIFRGAQPDSILKPRQTLPPYILCQPNSLRHGFWGAVAVAETDTPRIWDIVLAMDLPTGTERQVQSSRSWCSTFFTALVASDDCLLLLFLFSTF